MLQSGETEEAITFLDRALELDRDEPTVWEGKGLAALHQGDRKTDPALPVLFSCDVKMEAVQCGSFEYFANVYFDPASEKDPSTGALKVLAIEFRNR